MGRTGTALLLLAAIVGLVVALFVGRAEPGEEAVGPLSPARPEAVATGGGALESGAAREDVARREAAPSEPPQGRSAASTDTSRSGVLRGLVVEPDGTTPARGVQVALFPGTREPTPAAVAALLAIPSSGLLQRTDEAGAFTFVGLATGTPYALLCGAPGRVGARRLTVVQADRDYEPHRLHRLFGAWIELREPGGDAPRVYPGLTGQRAGRALSTQTGVFPQFGAFAAAVLAGVEAEALGAGPLDRRLQLFSSMLEIDEVGPFQFRANFPGYEPTDLAFHARRAPLGFPTVRAELALKASGFGAVEVEVVGWRGPCPAFVDRPGPDAFLRLAIPRGEVYHYEIERVDSQRTRIEGIPFGAYEASFGTSPHLRSTLRGGPRAQSLVVGPTPARLVLDLSGRASLELRLRDKEGQAHDGRAVLLVSADGQPTRGWRTYSFDGPPYRVDDLEPGPWSLVLQVPFTAGTRNEAPLPIALPSGGCTEVVLEER